MELDLGSDPLNPFSWPGDGVWPDFSQAALEADLDASDHAVGETMPDFVGYDLNDASVSLHQFY